MTLFRTIFALHIDAVPLTMAASNPCLLPDVIIEANRRDSELEGTSCASMKLLWIHMAASNPCLLPHVIIEANRRDSELEGTSCASMKLLWIHCEHTDAQVGLSFVPNR